MSPLHPNPVHTGEQGSVDVYPAVVHDHWLKTDILWILVAAINPHNAISWFVGHTVDGVEWMGTDDTHSGAQVIWIFPPDVTWNVFRLSNWQTLFGIMPKR